jgi:hypothetical protein
MVIMGEKLKLCPVCLGLYKRSREGVRQRKLAKAGELASWGKNKWPHELYHNGKTKICAVHASIAHAKCRQLYDDRSVVLASIGFASYADYLQSDLWRDIRECVFELFGNQCSFCGCQANQVHHANYTAETMRGDTYSGLYPVCQSCHTGGEFYSSSEKCTPKVATIRMREKACSNGYSKHVRLVEAFRKERLRTFTGTRTVCKCT